jgi:hypothetical protein
LKDQTLSASPKAILRKGAQDTKYDVVHKNEALHAQLLDDDTESTGIKKDGGEPEGTVEMANPGLLADMLSSKNNVSNVPDTALRRRKTQGLLRSLVKSDPRDKICRFFDLVAQCPDSAIANTSTPPAPFTKKVPTNGTSAPPALFFDKASVFTVWRPTRLVSPCLPCHHSPTTKK